MSLKFASILTLGLTTTALCFPAHSQGFFGWFKDNGGEQMAPVQPGFPQREIGGYSVNNQRQMHYGMLGEAAKTLEQGNYTRAAQLYSQLVAQQEPLAPLGLAVALAYQGQTEQAGRLLASHQFATRDISVAAERFRQQMTAQTAENTKAAPPENAGFLRVGVLLPQSGQLAGVGSQLVKAAELSVYRINQPQIVLQFEDAGSTEREAKEAAQRLLQLGVEVILGPLTSDQTDAVANLARRANVPVLSLSNNPKARQAGVSVLGHQPTDEMTALLNYAVSTGAQTVAALVPANGMGQQMTRTLQAEAAQRGLTIQRIITYSPTAPDITAQLKQLIQVDTASKLLAQEKAELEAEFGQLGGAMDDAKLARLQQLRTEKVQGVIDFDALVLGIPAGQLEMRLAELDFYDVNSSTTQLLVPTTLGRGEQRGGVIFPVVDPTSVGDFQKAYRDAYNADAAGLTHLVDNVMVMLADALQQANYNPNRAASLIGQSYISGSPIQISNGNVQHKYSIVKATDGRSPKILYVAPTNLPPIPDILLYR